MVVTGRVFTRFGRCGIFVLEKGIKGCEGICRVKGLQELCARAQPLNPKP